MTFWICAKCHLWIHSDVMRSWDVSSFNSCNDLSFLIIVPQILVTSCQCCDAISCLLILTMMAAESQEVFSYWRTVEVELEYDLHTLGWYCGTENIIDIVNSNNVHWHNTHYMLQAYLRNCHFHLSIAITTFLSFWIYLCLILSPSMGGFTRSSCVYIYIYVYIYIHTYVYAVMYVFIAVCMYFRLRMGPTHVEDR